jgi:hypothetical protein
MRGAKLYRSLTARVNAPVRPLIASGPQFLHIRDAGPDRVRIGFGPFRGLCWHTVRQLSASVSIEGKRMSRYKDGFVVQCDAPVTWSSIT